MKRKLNVEQRTYEARIHTCVSNPTMENDFVRKYPKEEPFKKDRYTHIRTHTRHEYINKNTRTHTETYKYIHIHIQIYHIASEEDGKRVLVEEEYRICVEVIDVNSPSPSTTITITPSKRKMEKNGKKIKDRK
ncbi:hypothetical protein V1477_006762 [Vespula maculifrons]|uniref:Uncharacterized protein n=1 Tax=Vespula maculifrons TaxID=7453 RepID=A0ABD2CHC5_VESMC